MLRCEDDSIYTGITTNLKRRTLEHFSKNTKCAKYTKRHTPKYLECAWSTKDRSLASKLEFHIKKLTKIQKEELIEKNDLDKLLFEKVVPREYNRLKQSAISDILSKSKGR